MTNLKEFVARVTSPSSAYPMPDAACEALAAYDKLVGELVQQLEDIASTCRGIGSDDAHYIHNMVDTSAAQAFGYGHE